MNKLTLLLLFVTLVLAKTTFAQKEKKYLIGIEGKGGFSRGENMSEGKDLNISGNIKLYTGRFVSPNTAIYAHLGIGNYNALISTENFTVDNETVHFKGYEYIINPKFGLGIRKYFSLKKDKVGLFVDGEFGYGFNVKRLRYEMDYETRIEELQSTETTETFNTNILLGSYLNLNSNWQILLKIGGIYYDYIGTKDREGRTRNIYSPEKGSYMQVNFNDQTFRLSIARFI